MTPRPEERLQTYGSRVSLHLELLFGDQHLAKGTGFLLRSDDGQTHLVTNWHLLSGRNPETDECLHKLAAVPDRVRIHHHSSAEVQKREAREERLYHNESGERRWLEHPRGGVIDIAVLPLLEVDPPVETVFLRRDLANDGILLLPGLPVAIVGFPYGLHVGRRWPIWKTGHVASDPGYDYDGRPSFLIDATTRPGMSGSPIFFQSPGPFVSSMSRQELNARLRLEFLGIYSGRIHEAVEVARGWPHHVIREILEANDIQWLE